MSVGAEFEPALTLTVDLAGLVANWRLMRRLSGAAETSAVVKADAYGLGIDQVVPALWRAGCRTFFVATPCEGRAVRRSAPGSRIFVLNGLVSGDQAALRADGLIPVLSSLRQIDQWAGAGPFALQVDTGMNRLGLSGAEAKEAAGLGARPVLVLSHLACADTPGASMNAAQLQDFQAVRKIFPEIESSLCNSAGILLGGDYLHDLTRPGIALYGGDAALHRTFPLAVVATAAARIMQIRRVPAGAGVSYAGAHRLARDSVIATCAVGYADGYPRGLSGAGVPLRQAVDTVPAGWLAGRRVPVVGRVTMDLTMFDLTELAPDSVNEGDAVELFGPNMPIDEVAQAAGTIAYELLTALGRRYRRSHVGDP